MYFRFKKIEKQLMALLCGNRKEDAIFGDQNNRHVNTFAC